MREHGSRVLGQTAPATDLHTNRSTSCPPLDNTSENTPKRGSVAAAQRRSASHVIAARPSRPPRPSSRPSMTWGSPQGDRTILTRLLTLSHSAFSAASTKTPHERRRAQVRTLGPGRVSTPVRWGREPSAAARRHEPVCLAPALPHWPECFRSRPRQWYDQDGAITLADALVQSHARC